MTKYLSTFILILFSLASYCQNNRIWGIESKFKTGILLGHRPVMGHLAEHHVFAGELSLYLRTDGRNKWHSAYKYPDLGVTFYGGTAGNKEVLGNFFGVNSFLSIPFIAKPKFRFNGKLSAGLGLGTKQYDPVTNPKNVAMSTPLNAMICLGLDAKYYFKQNWFSLGIDMTHFSNGAFKVPNLGINLPYMGFAYGRFLKKPEIDTSIIAQENHMPFRKIFFGGTAIISAKEVFPTGGKKISCLCIKSTCSDFFKTTRWLGNCHRSYVKTSHFWL